jgi:PleD family two-component response regulator
VENLRIDYEDISIRITVSIGVNHVNGSRLGSEDNLIDQADNALYISKNSGRNRVSIYNPGFLFKAEQIRHPEN